MYKNPLLWVSIPIVIGIAVGKNISLNIVLDRLGIVLLFWVGLLFFAYLKKNVFILKELFPYFFVLTLFFAGLFWQRLNEQFQKVEVPNTVSTYVGIITEIKAKKGTLFQTTCYFPKLKENKVVNKKVQVFLQKKEDGGKIVIGDILLFKGQLKPLKKTHNPEEFDYVSYLNRKGIIFQIFVSKDYWKKMQNEKVQKSILKNIPFTLWLQLEAQKIKIKLLEKYGSYFPDRKIKAFVLGVSLGHKEELQVEEKALYAEMGVSHVLALSGLHIGILSTILVFLFSMNSKKRKYKITAYVITMIFLWGFAVLVGLPTSMVRGMIMYTMLNIAFLSDRTATSLNNLALAVLILLFINPENLFDVGFQMSFIAVLGILLFYPRLLKIIKPQKRFLQKIWSFIAILISTQVAVLPISIYYFNVVPTYFLLANSIAIPITYIVLILTILFCLPFGIIKSFAVFGITYLVNGMNLFFSWIHSLPFSGWKLFISIEIVYLLYILMLLICFFKKKYVRQYIFWGGIWIIGFVFAFYENHQQKHLTTQIWIYSHPKKITLHYIKNKYENFVWSWKLEHYIPSRFCEKYELEKAKELSLQNNFFEDKHLKMLFLDYATLKSLSNNLKTKKQVDYLVILPQVKNKLEDILKVSTPKCIILPRALNEKWRNYYYNKGKELGILIYDMEEKGAFNLKIESY